jgi:hypothetical protein
MHPRTISSAQDRLKTAQLREMDIAALVYGGVEPETVACEMVSDIEKGCISAMPIDECGDAQPPPAGAARACEL